MKPGTNTRYCSRWSARSGKGTQGSLPQRSLRGGPLLVLSSHMADDTELYRSIVIVGTTRAIDAKIKFFAVPRSL